jgi:hypothetical protein
MALALAHAYGIVLDPEPDPEPDPAPDPEPDADPTEPGPG